MKAVVLIDKGKRQLEDRPTPTAERGDLLLRINACGICGSDLVATPSPNTGAYKANVIMGHEFCGTVVEIGDGASGVELGDLVVANVMALACGKCEACRRGLPNQCVEALDRTSGFTHDGGLAEFVAIPSGYAHRVPKGLDARSAAWTEPLAAAVRGVSHGDLRHGTSVAVLGAGSIGQVVLQMALAQGVGETLVVEPAVFRREVALQSGAIDAVSPDDAANVDRLFDVVFECSGSIDAIATALELVAPGGRVVLIGGYGPSLSISPGLAARREASIHFSMTYRDRYEFATALNFLARGVVEVEPLTTVLPLSRADEAFALLQDPEQAIKIVLDPSLD